MAWKKYRRCHVSKFLMRIKHGRSICLNSKETDRADRCRQHETASNHSHSYPCLQCGVVTHCIQSDFSVFTLCIVPRTVSCCVSWSPIGAQTANGNHFVKCMTVVGYSRPLYILLQYYISYKSHDKAWLVCITHCYRTISKRISCCGMHHMALATFTGHDIQEAAKGTSFSTVVLWLVVLYWLDGLNRRLCGFQHGGLLMASWGWFSSIWPSWDFKWMLEINHHLRSQARVGCHHVKILVFGSWCSKAFKAFGMCFFYWTSTRPDFLLRNLKLGNCDRLVWHREQHHCDHFRCRVVNSVWWLKGWRCCNLYCELYEFGVSGYAQDVHHSSLRWPKVSFFLVDLDTNMAPRLVLKLAAYKVRGQGPAKLTSEQRLRDYIRHVLSCNVLYSDYQIYLTYPEFSARFLGCPKKVLAAGRLLLRAWPILECLWLCNCWSVCLRTRGGDYDVYSFHSNWVHKLVTSCRSMHISCNLSASTASMSIQLIGQMSCIKLKPAIPLPFCWDWPRNWVKQTQISCGFCGSWKSHEPCVVFESCACCATSARFEPFCSPSAAPCADRNVRFQKQR